MGIYKRKQESKKTKTRPRKWSRKKERFFFFLGRVLVFFFCFFLNSKLSFGFSKINQQKTISETNKNKDNINDVIEVISMELEEQDFQYTSLEDATDMGFSFQGKLPTWNCYNNKSWACLKTYTRCVTYDADDATF